MRRRRESLVRRIGADFRQQPVALDAAFDARVMTSVRALPRHRRVGLWSRLRRPRTLTITPLTWGLAAAACLLAAAVIGDKVHASRVATPIAVALQAPVRGRAAAAAKKQGKRVQFVLVAPTARKVAVVGDFNDWDAAHHAYQAAHNGGGVWAVTAPVPVGHHRYAFVVDDSLLVTDPAAPRVVDDDFGVPSSALVVDAGR